MGHRQRSRWPHGDRPGARHARRLRSLRRRRQSPRPGGRARHRLPGVAGSSVGARTSGVVPAPAGRLDQVRREPAEEVPGHLPVRFRESRLAWRCGTRCATCSSSGSRTASRIFRVDNPHTKPFRFWEWCIAEIKREHPDAIFLAEAFTRPKVMRYLAKAGFTQSYTYFTWRNTAGELREYLTELTTHASRASTCGRTSSPTRRTSCTSTCSTADGRLRGAAASSPRRWRRATASTAASSCARTWRCGRAPRSISTRRSTRSSIARLESAGQPQRADRAASTRSGATTRRCSRTTRCRSIRRDNPPAAAAFTKHDGRPRDRRVRRRQHRSRIDMQHGWVEVCRLASSASCRRVLRRRGPARRRALHVARRMELRAARSGANAWRTSSWSNRDDHALDASDLL